MNRLVGLVSFLFISALLARFALADEIIEEVIVQSAIVKSEVSTIADPLHVISEAELSSNPSQSLGETIDSLLGVASADYGAAVGQPIIRGMSGTRVRVLNNGMVIRDVTSLGADHVNEVDFNHAQQVEIIKGPASLLYTNGVIGGIVNVVDDTIARTDVEGVDISLGLETQSVNEGDAQTASIATNIGGFNVFAAYSDSDLENYDVPDGAVIHEEEEHHDEDEHEGEEEHHDDEHEEESGFVNNSDFATTKSRFGISRTGDWGHIGLSYSDSESVYGIPFHGDDHGGHGGHDDHDDDHGDEHGEDHDEDEHGDEEEHHDEDEHEEEGHGGHSEDERIFSTTDFSILNFEGSLALDAGIFKGINYFYRDSEYTLTEDHAEEEGHEEEMGGHDDHDDHGHEEGPTVFTNDSTEFGATIDLSTDALNQKVSFNSSQEDIAIIGAEAFMRPTERTQNTFGYFASKSFEAFNLDVGIRHDLSTTKGSLAHSEEEHHDEDEHEGEEEHHDEEEHEEEIEYIDSDDSATSFAVSLSRDMNENFSVNLGFASVGRTPAATEMLMNGPHLATRRFEKGNPNLKAERSNNLDFTLNFQNQGYFGELTLFSNSVSDYIYLMDETEEEHEEHEDEHDDHGGLILAEFLQQDADFTGYELEIGKTFDLSRGNLSLSYGRDSVTAEFSNGGNVPRIIPARNIYSISYLEDTLAVRLSLKDVGKQSDTAIGETATEGYQMLNLRANKSIQFDSGLVLNLTAFGNNLMDEVARNHSSFVKNEVPLPGRNLGVKFSIDI